MAAHAAAPSMWDLTALLLPLMDVALLEVTKWHP